jgi:hypothetical protein
MLWLAFEIALGLALFLAIIWWTLPRKRRRDADPPRDPE